MGLEQLWRAVPGLENAIRRQPLAVDREATWVMLRALLQAYAPSTGTTLPNAIVDQVSDIAAAFGLVDRLDPELGGIGNAGLWLGVAGGRVDLLVVAHLDRLTFWIEALDPDGRNARVLPVGTAATFEALPPAPAVALRLEDGRLGEAAQGYLQADQRGMRFQTESGTLLPSDLITFSRKPQRRGDRIQGVGIDNAAGVLCALGVAAVLRRVEEILLEYDRRCLFVFPDRRDFSLTALMAAKPALCPRLGVVVVDVQRVAAGAADTGAMHGAGTAYSLSNEHREGLLVPLNYRQLTHMLANDLNTARPASVQQGLSGTLAGDMADSDAWRGRILGYMGPPVSQPHPGDEAIHLHDVQATVWWLACYVAAILNLAPEIAGQYALGR